MNPNCNTQPTKASKPPKDGWGPRGVPDCYYTSRVLNSTGHYVRFIKKLRAIEEDTRIGLENFKSRAKDNECIEFFSRCDRRNLINKVANRVEYCLQGYQDDVAVKRQKLKELLRVEEEMNLHKLVEQVQSGYELMWKEKVDRLAYLLAKRKKEHEDLYNDTHLSKCAHVQPCIRKIQAKEAEEIQLYQMREKQMRKLAENEMDKLWHEVMMKETEALAARMEYDVINRYRRDLEAKEYTIAQIESKRVQRAKEQEMLMQEFLKMKAKFEEDNRKAEEEELRLKNERYELGQQKLDMIRERKETVAKLQADADVVNRTWDSLATQGLADEKAKLERRRQKERDLDECNFKMVEMKNRIAQTKFNSDPLILQEGQRRQDAVDMERCQRRLRAKKANKANQAAILQQSKEKREAVQEKEEAKARDEYNRQVKKQLDQLVKHKQLTDAQARKLHQNDLVKQIEYNKILKERAKDEWLNENKKCQIAMKEYQEEIKKMLSRPFYSDQVHPFMKQMASGIKMREPCPCCGPDYCYHRPPPEQEEK
ncbi:unnamed protein product [Arctia plantaginis]|uniref:Trichohyalin-plectin-homology domain-containing protein n=1 Tax=Arctia plantaginis TaxID=874455 RepID=A0A8S0Z1P6_ARCPL|nr:unnamed protein product [Arctia plantaginis]